MSRKVVKSPLLQLLDVVWENSLVATCHSYGRLNTAMRDALRLAIGSGFEFTLGDMTYVFSNYRSGYWLGADQEWVYSSAIVEANLSAARSYEAAVVRKPFMANRVMVADCLRFGHQAGVRDRERLHVGAKFNWQGDYVTVTSFRDDVVVACAYHGEEFHKARANLDAASSLAHAAGVAEPTWGSVIRKRYRITRLDLKSKGAA